MLFHFFEISAYYVKKVENTGNKWYNKKMRE